MKLPFLVMTSDDTHAAIGTLLQQHAHYGLAPSQVTLLKQQKSKPNPNPNPDY